MNNLSKLLLFLVVAFYLALCTFYSASAEVATIPANLSPRGVAAWSLSGGFIGSGSGALPTVASEGVRYTDLTDPTKPVDYRSNGVAWVAVSSAGGGSTATITAGIASVAEEVAGVASDTQVVSTDLAEHMADSVDPHGSDMQVTERVLVGSGTPDSSVERLSTGTIGVASYLALPWEVATPTVASGVMTLWADPNTGKLRIFNGTDTWNDAY